MVEVIGGGCPSPRAAQSRVLDLLDAPNSDSQVALVSGIATMVIRVLAFLAIWVRGYGGAGWLAAFCASERPHVTPTSCSFLE